MRKLVKKAINRALSPLGLKIARPEPPGVDMATYIRCITEFHGFYIQHVFPTLPVMENRVQFLANLGGGCGISKAMYILDCLHKACEREGDVCEFGVAQGTTSALIANELQHTDKNLWLFDSFTGLGKPTAKDQLLDDILGLGSIEAYQGTLSHQASEVQARLKETGFPESRVRIIPGYIEETMNQAQLPEKTCFAFIDFDFYEPTAIALKLLSTRWAKGGYAIVDDYGFFSSGAKTAVDEFLSAHGDAVEMTLPPTYAGRFAILRNKL